jgi:hypothetical protein
MGIRTHHPIEECTSQCTYLLEQQVLPTGKPQKPKRQLQSTYRAQITQEHPNQQIVCCREDKLIN